jgi:hypothetical protein
MHDVWWFCATKSAFFALISSAHAGGVFLIDVPEKTAVLAILLF